MRIAIIDMGTNTFNLAVFETAKEKTFRMIFRDKCNVQLGKDTLVENTISEEAVQRAIEALKKHRQSAESYHADHIFAFATSAVRDAKNQAEFLSVCEAQTGLSITVLSGNDEAEYIYHGVKQAVDLGEQPTLIMDIGGGSTEFIIGNRSTIFWRHSFNLGISRLLQYFTPTDPITKKEIDAVHHFLEKELKPLHKALEQTPVTTLVGSSGSFRTLVSLILGILHNTKRSAHKSKSYHIAIEDYILICRLLIQSTSAERKTMKGMDPMRVELMVLAVIFIRYIILRYNIQSIIQSNYAIKEGALWTIINENS